jgi:hypothetical protein
MEHPTGRFPTALAAMTDIVERLRALGERTRWITFSAQGQGSGREAYHFADLRLLGDEIDLLGHDIDLEAVLRLARLDGAGLDIERQPGALRVKNATPEQLARLLDALYRGALGVRPFDGDDDYAVGAEW